MTRAVRTLGAAIAIAAFAAAAIEGQSAPEATSLLGKPLVSAPPTGAQKARLDADLARAQAEYDKDMTLRRLGRDAEARQALDPIRERMDILENDAYHARLLMYRGLRTPESVLNLNTADDVQIATQGYGVGNWYLVNGDRAKAREIFEKVVAGRAWTAFGFIAAEADLKRGL